MSENVRWDLIRHIREQIAAGTYETQKKREVVVDRLIEEIEAIERG